MIKKILLTNIARIAASLWLSMIIIPLASTHDGWYLHDSDGNPIRDSYGRCVFAVLGNMIDECEEEREEVAIIEPQQAPEPVARPEPIVEVEPVHVTQKAPVKPKYVKTKPELKPKPKVAILNLNESGGSNFATASAELSINAQELLANLVNRIETANIVPSNVTIEGHTDSRGSESLNQRLSLQRAQSVAIYLATLGVDPIALHVAGKGELQPIADNNTKSGRARNRRVAIRVTGQRTIIK